MKNITLAILVDPDRVTKAILTLNVEEDGLLPGAVVVLSPDDVLPAVVELDPVDHKRVVVHDVALHVLDRLAQLAVVVVPGDRGRGAGDHAARELGALALVGKRALGADHEPRGRLPPVWEVENQISFFFC